MELQNEWVSARFSLQAAEVISFQDKLTNIEYVWNRDATYWSNCNPILFPVVGKAWGEEYEVDGKKYRLGKHGFARYATFSCIEKTDNSITFELRENDETLRQYPYHFRLSVTYSLDQRKLWLNYCVQNNDSRIMPFQIGFHPAFNCPFTMNKKFDDYKLILEQTENTLSNNGYLLQKELSMQGNSSFQEKSALFFSNLKSEHVDLSDGEHAIRVGIDNFKRVGFWHKSVDTPFLCIEPQHGHGYVSKDNHDIPEDNTILLSPQKSYQTAYYWEIIATDTEKSSL